MPPSMPTPPETGARWRIVHVGRDLLPAAAHRLVEAATTAGPDAAAQFLRAARAHDIDLRRMWASIEGDGGDGGSEGDSGGGGAAGRQGVREVCLVVPGSGRTAMFFTSHPSGDGRMRELGAVISHSCDQCGDAARVGQALLETKDADLATAYEAGGFERIARLWYLTRPAPKPGELPESPAAWPEGVTVKPWGQGDDPALVRALDGSYEDTLDCPELSRIRRPEEVLESHRAAGQWEPNLWWLVRLHGQPEGAMLFNPSPGSGTVELVYLGLSPRLRGRRLGTALLNHGLSCLVGRTERSVTCAVDQRNTPACALYERFGFVRFDERIALVRALGAPGG